MVPFSTMIDPKSMAFQTAFSLGLRQNKRRALVTRTRPSASTEQHKIKPSKKPSSALSTTENSPSATSPRRHGKQDFIYRPEAVLSILALGILSSMAYFANAGRRIATDVSARAKRIAQENSQLRRYKARLHEKSFLESAVEATQATLSNTEDFLAKQIKRAEHAEERLRELEVSSAEVDASNRRAQELKIELKEKEAELEEKRLNTEETAESLASIQADVDNRREALSVFEEEVKEAQRELSEAQRNASESLKLASAEKQHLEVVFEQKQAQLAEETAARDKFMQRIAEEESSLQETEALVDETLKNIEVRRKKIDAVAKQAEHIGKVASDEKLALETAIVREVRAEDIEDSLQQISEQQRVLKGQIQSSLKSEAQQATICSDLRKELEERDMMLQQQRAKLFALNNGTNNPRRSSARDAEGSTEQDNASREGQLIEADGPSPYHVFESAVIQDNIHSTSLSDSIAAAGTEAPIPPSTTVLDSDQVPAKRRRRRPRKPDADGSREPQLTKSKKGRGRARTRVSDDTAKEMVPKKKRGRPRKTAIAAMKENTAPQPISSGRDQLQGSSD